MSDATSSILADFIIDTSFDCLSNKTIQHTKNTLLDTLACALGGYTSPPGEIARKLAHTVSSTDLPSRILGESRTSTPDMAAFANAAMIRYLDCNDSYFSPGGGHPSDMIAAALTLTEALNNTGKDLIESIVIGYEIFTKLSDQVVVSKSGWDQGIFIGLSAASIAAKLLKLSKPQIINALSLSIVPNLPMGATRMGELSMWKGCATAAAVKSGIFAALLAKEGMTSPDNIFKFYPSQIHTQAPIGLACKLSSEVIVDDIKTIAIQSYQQGGVSTPETEPEKWAPSTRETADHSIPFLVASALSDGTVNPETFTETNIKRTIIKTLITKTNIVENSDFSNLYPSQYNCRIDITTQSGSIHTGQTAYPKGHPQNPFTDTDLQNKFSNLSGALLSKQRRETTLDLLMDIDHAASITPLFNSVDVTTGTN